MISAAVFSDDDEKIFTGGWDGKVKIWDAEYLKEIKTLQGHKSHVNALCEWSDETLFSGGVYELLVWNTKKNQYKKIPVNQNIIDLHKVNNQLFIVGKKGIGLLKNPEQSAYVKQVYFSRFEIVDSELINDSTLLISADKELHLLDLQTFSIIQSQTLPKIDRIKSIHFDSTLKLISCSGMNQSYLFQSNSLEHLTTFNDLYNSTVVINKSLVGINYGSTNVDAYDIESKQLIRSFETTTSTPTSNLIVSHSGDFVLGYGYSNMTLWNKSGIKIHDFKRIKNPIHGVNTADHLISCGIGSKGEGRVFNLKTLQFEESFRYHGSTVQSTLIKDNHLWLFGADQRAVKIDLDNYTVLREFNIEDPQKPVPPIQEMTAMEQLSSGLFGEQVHQAIENQEGDLIFQMNNDIKILKNNNDQYNLLKGHTDYVKDIKLTNDEKYLLSASLDKTIKLWNLKKRKCLNTFEKHTDRVFALEVIDQEHFVSGSANGELFLWHINEGYSVSLDQLGGSIFAITLVQDFIIVGHNNGLTIYDKSSHQKLKSYEKNLAAIKVIKPINDQMFLTEDKNERLQLWTIEGLLANLIFTEEGSIIYTPQSHYFGSKKAIQSNVHFSDGKNMYLFDQFDLLYNRPDIIAKQLQLSDSKLIQVFEKAYEKRVARIGNSTEVLISDFNVPSIEWTQSDKPESSTTQSEISLSFSASSPNEIAQIHLLINDVPVLGSAGKTIAPSKELNHTEKVELANGKNKIQFYVTDINGVHSPKITKYIIKSSQNHESVTYLICIGASKYKQSEFDLNYAAKDAQDILDLFKSRHANLKSKILTNEKVTREEILKLGHFLQDAQRDDQVIIFYAGHGVLDADLNYYFASHDMDFKNPKTAGIPYEQMEKILDGIKPLRKLFFIDACHSGEIDKSEIEIKNTTVTEDGDLAFRSMKGISISTMAEYSAFELSKNLFADIRTGNGATVIASAGGLEFAIEGDKWKNGLFTYSILSGVNGGLADLNGDGEIWLSELQKFVSNRVFDLSNGAQRPTSRIENQTIDFKLF